MSFIQSNIVDHCEKWLPYIKEHSRKPAICEIQKQRRSLEPFAEVMAYTDFLSPPQLDELISDFERIDYLLRELDT